jgi:pilus assembly protein Flp/PilA
MFFTRLWVAAQSRPSMSERGASLVEYALLLTLIAVVAIAAIRIIGQNVNTNLEQVGTEIGNG